MIRFQCPDCGGIVAIESGDMGTMVECGHCSKIVKTPEDRVSPGSVIGDFIIRREIGRGGMGIVYEAHQISLDRPAALKVLSEAYANNSEFVVGFIKEARAAAKLNHPHVVQAYAVGEDEGLFYLAMEYIDGETMKGYLKRLRVVEPLQAINIIQQIAEALSYAWSEQKLIHRDIKPDNIMLTSSGRAKLADLGLARVAGDVDDADQDEVMGTPQYICPEHLTGAPMDVRSDIYSLGATFYHFVTGRFPFEGSTAAEIAQKHITCPLTPAMEINKEIPQCVSMIIDKMMEKNPLMRYPDADSLVDDLRAARKMVEAGCTTTKMTSLLRPKDPADPSAVSSRLFSSDADELVRPSGLKKLFMGKAKYAVIGAAVLLLGGGGAAAALLLKGDKAVEPVKAEVKAETEVAEKSEEVKREEVKQEEVKQEEVKQAAKVVTPAAKPVKVESALVKSLRAELAYAKNVKNKPADIVRRGNAFIGKLPKKISAEETKLANELKSAVASAKARIPKPLTPAQKAALAKKAAAEKARAAAEAKRKAEAAKKAAAAAKARAAAEAKRKAEAAKKAAAAAAAKRAAAARANQIKNTAAQMKREIASLNQRAYRITSKRIIVTKFLDRNKYASEFASAVKLYEDWMNGWSKKAKAKNNAHLAATINTHLRSVNQTVLLLKHCQAIHEFAYKGGKKMSGVYIGRYQVVSTSWKGMDYRSNNVEQRLDVEKMNFAVRMRLVNGSALKQGKHRLKLNNISLLAYYHILAGDTEIAAKGMGLSMQQKQALANYFNAWNLPAKEKQILLKKPAPPKKAPPKKAPPKKAPAKKNVGPGKTKDGLVQITIPGASTTMKHGGSAKKKPDATKKPDAKKK